MKKEDIEKCNEWFSKYGLISALIGRNFPIVRTLISLPMGITRQPFFPFFFYTTLGSIPWTFLFVYLGYLLGDNWIVVNAYIDYLKIPIRIVLFVLLIKHLLRKIKKNDYC